MPRIALYKGAQRIQVKDFGVSTEIENSVTVSIYEDVKYTFSVEEREPGVSYALRTGDIPLESEEGNRRQLDDECVGRTFGPNVFWEESMYFSGARGRVEMSLLSRADDGDGDKWVECVRWPIYVISTKTTEQAFESMCEELRRLAGGLLFDLVSKSTVGIGRSTQSRKPVWYFSSQLELRLLEKLWTEFADALAEVLDRPWTKLNAVTKSRLTYGSERIDQRAVIGLVAAGKDPRHSHIPKPFHVRRTVLEESTNTIEHQVIAGFLEFLVERVLDCQSNIESHIQSLVDDREYRTLPSGAGLSLYESMDLPKIAKLRSAQLRAKRLESLIRSARGTSHLSLVQARFPFVDSPVFRNIESYYRLRMLIHQYMSSSLIVLAEGQEERLKATDRLYEQWVLIQLASSLRFLGMSCESMEGMLNRVRRYRYTLDIDRGAQLTFTTGSEDWFIVVRYEPWIHPEHIARQSKDELFKGDSGRASWSPDILIEFCRKSRLATEVADYVVEYAVVVDAKYSRRIGEHHRRDVGKYHEIRSTSSRRQVVRQVWIAAPVQNTDAEILNWDSAVSWTENGPTCEKDEYTGGVISLIPEKQPSSVEEDRWLSQPNETALRFMKGLLRYVGIQRD